MTALDVATVNHFQPTKFSSFRQEDRRQIALSWLAVGP